MRIFEVRATFHDAEEARLASERRSLGRRIVSTERSTDQTTHENRFMGRVVLVIIGWSIVGAAIGAALGVVFAMTIGPSGTEGLIIQVVVWAIFAHLLIGMWAGYMLLADRTGPELPATRATPVVMRVECATIDESEFVRAEMDAVGATSVDVRETDNTQYQV
jgi:hypothetical protein